jgi:hypothetical protein
MAYTISNTDGTTLVLLADGTVDNASTSLTLIGRNVSSYGEYYNNNLVKLTANFASPTINPPRSPLKGQIWYDTTAKRLKIYDNGFKNITGATISPTRPETLTTGDFWFDSTNNQLKIINGSASLLIGPAFPLAVGENGWVLPASFIRNEDYGLQTVTLMKNYGTTLGAISASQFKVDSEDSTTYFNTSSFTLVKGFTVLGDINYTGKIKDNYLTLTVDIDRLTPANPDIYDDVDFAVQTNSIKSLLNAVFPINSTTNYIENPANPLSKESGVLPESEARVICTFTTPFVGHQVRRFIAKNTDYLWDYYEINNSAVTATNVIATITT